MHVCAVEKQNMCELVQNISCALFCSQFVCGPVLLSSTCCFSSTALIHYSRPCGAFWMWAEHSSAAVVPARHVQLQSLAAAAHAALIGPVGEVEAGGAPDGSCSSFPAYFVRRSLSKLGVAVCSWTGVLCQCDVSPAWPISRGPLVYLARSLEKTL